MQIQVMMHILQSRYRMLMWHAHPANTESAVLEVLQMRTLKNSTPGRRSRRGHKGPVLLLLGLCRGVRIVRGIPRNILHPS